MHVWAFLTFGLSLPVTFNYHQKKKNAVHKWAISDFDKNNSVWICVQGPYSHPTDFFLITYRSELFQTFNKYDYVWLCVQGPYSHPTDFILITYRSELFQTFDKYNSEWLCVQGPYSHLTNFILITYIISDFW